MPDGVAGWLAGIIGSAETLPDEEGPEAPPDVDAEVVADIIEKLVEIIDDLADDMRGDPKWRQETPQKWGTELHNRLDKYIKNALEVGELVLAQGFDIHAERSLRGGDGNEIERDINGKIVWAPRGEGGTYRPDVMITQWVGGKEKIIMVLDLKTGKARISKSWRDGLQKLFYGPGEPMDAPIQPIRPTNPKRVAGFVTFEEGELPWD